MNVTGDDAQEVTDFKIEVPVAGRMPLRLFVRPLKRLLFIERVLITPEGKSDGYLTLVLKCDPDQECHDQINEVLRKTVEEYPKVVGNRLAQLMLRSS